MVRLERKIFPLGEHYRNGGVDGVENMSEHIRELTALESMLKNGTNHRTKLKNERGKVFTLKGMPKSFTTEALAKLAEQQDEPVKVSAHKDITGDRAGAKCEMSGADLAAWIRRRITNKEEVEFLEKAKQEAEEYREQVKRENRLSEELNGTTN